MKRIFALATVVFFSLSTQAAEIDQIVVTGARSPLNVEQIGSAVTIITREDIEWREARHVTDLLRTVPGFSVSHSGVTGSQAQVRVRGAEANHVLVLIDGIRANDPATGDEFRWEFLSAGNIERIEIVRGPQSSLWGSDAVAAVVHIITRSESSTSSGDIYAESGSFDTRNAGMNGALSGDAWVVRGGIEHLSTDGSNVSRTGTEKDGADLTTASLSARLAASDALSLSMGLRTVDAWSQYDPVDFVATGLPTDGDVATDIQNHYAQAGATFAPVGSRVSQQINIRYFDSDNLNLVDGALDSSTASDRVTFAYQADIGIGENRLSLALEREETQFEQSGAVVFGDPNQTQEMDVNSAIAEFQGLSTEHLTWIVSLRADDNSSFDDAVSGRVSIAYELSDATTLRGSIGTGQKNPTFIERFGYFPSQFIGNPELKPEHSVSYDIGIDQRLADDRLQLQASLFQQDLTDEINGFVFDPVSFLSTAENMQGKSERSGIELAARFTASESIGFAAHYTYTDSKEQDPLGNDLVELRRPRHAGGVSVDFKTTNERFSTTLNADYGGARSDIYYPLWPEPSEIVSLSDYWLVDLAAQYRATPSVTLFARASNLLDEDY
ncbi:MAG: TonB-dependent receptor, partial [Gammaproteobacteria bacterium]|nr:TonB-dependent receptor [Gammaproteobacteria bacterium]